MSTATKLAIVEKLLPLVEAFGTSRRVQSETRRAMKAASCTHAERMQMLPSDPEGELEERYVPCYDNVLGRTPWCDACRQHDLLFSRLMAERKANKKRLQKIERLAVAFAKPEDPEPPERKELLELIDQQLASEAASHG